jgi:hypothetical protein
MFATFSFHCVPQEARTEPCVGIFSFF